MQWPWTRDLCECVTTCYREVPLGRVEGGDITLWPLCTVLMCFDLFFLLLFYKPSLLSPPHAFLLHHCQCFIVMLSPHQSSSPFSFCIFLCSHPVPTMLLFFIIESILFPFMFSLLTSLSLCPISLTYTPRCFYALITIFILPFIHSSFTIPFICADNREGEFCV